MADDLNTPLGQGKKPKRNITLPAFLPQALAAALGLCLAGFLLFAATADDPMGGEPVAVVAVEPAGKAGEDAQPPVKVVTPSRYDGPDAASGPEAGGQTVTIIDGTSGKREEVTLPATPGSPRAGNPNPPAGNDSAPSAPSAPNPRLIETSRHGGIPKIGADGSRPSEAYARPVKAAAEKPDGPRIAIVVSGLGIGTSGTADALAKLPGPVTFAFAPYSANIEQLAARARNEGHEVLLQVPMEPFDYPDNDPGPQTLLTGSDAGQNIDRLHWLLSRFQGYVGISNYMGARFTASEPALAPVLRETAKRGLLYLDDGTSPRSLAGQIAGANRLAFAKAEVVIDAVPTATEIDRALARLEAAARERGIAVGIAGALPVAIERIAKWTKAAETRGFTLVPISAVANKPKSS
ncbi:MAG TPA: divergent polysaccharide deacetylase family protein [Xanthobacteraceae bacterium]|nr:divergent polysaccharide deacetylase family protein [Xanthobacteraceae bacterium]